MLVPIFLVLTAGSAFARHPKVASDLDISNPQAMVDVIVQFKQAPTAAQHARVGKLGGVHRHGLEIIRIGHYVLPANEVEKLADDADVEFIHPDRVVSGTAFSGKVDYGWMTVTGLTSTGGKLPYDGANIGVAVIDSGMDNHEDFKDASGKLRILCHKLSFVPNDTHFSDAYGHGNYVGGSSAAVGKDQPVASTPIRSEVLPQMSNSSTCGCSTHPWTSTQCLSRGRWSPHSDWYMY